MGQAASRILDRAGEARLFFEFPKTRRQPPSPGGLPLPQPDPCLITSRKSTCKGGRQVSQYATRRCGWSLVDQDASAVGVPQQANELVTGPRRQSIEVRPVDVDAHSPRQRPDRRVLDHACHGPAHHGMHQHDVDGGRPQHPAEHHVFRASSVEEVPIRTGGRSSTDTKGEALFGHAAGKGRTRRISSPFGSKMAFSCSISASSRCSPTAMTSISSFSFRVTAMLAGAEHSSSVPGTAAEMRSGERSILTVRALQARRESRGGIFPLWFGKASTVSLAVAPVGRRVSAALRSHALDSH